MNSSLINKVQQRIERKLTRIQVFTFCVLYKRPNYLEMLNNASKVTILPLLVALRMTFSRYLHDLSLTNTKLFMLSPRREKCVFLDWRLKTECLFKEKNFPSNLASLPLTFTVERDETSFCRKLDSLLWPF